MLTGNGSAAIKFQCPYGLYQRRYWWLFGVVALAGVVGVPTGIFFNTGWKSGNHPLEPWAATLIIEIFSVGALLIAAYFGLLLWQHSTSPRRVAVTSSGLIVPRGVLSNKELVLPFAEIELAVFNLGFVQQVKIKRGRKTVLLVSARFPADEDFEQFVRMLPV